MSSCLSKRSWQIVTLLCFCSSVSSFGTIFAHTFLMLRSSVKIFLTVPLSMFTCSTMLLTVSRRFSCRIWRIFAMFSSILLVAGRPDLCSSMTLSLPSKTFHPLVNCCFLRSIIPVNLHWHLSDFLPLFPSLTRNLMFILCSNSSSDILAAAHQNTRGQ